mgnify:CR=1 FL=1|jgi:hypothetical protein
MIKIITVILSLVNVSATFALEPLAEDELQQVLGQGGVYLSGDITINEAGGPLNVTSDASNPAVWQQNCTVGSTSKRCGARIAVNAGDGANSGWLVLDNIRGRFSFEGMTLKTRSINNGFGGDGVLFDSDVLEIGLPNTVSYSNVSFTLANSSEARPTDVGFNQTDILNVKIDGDVSLRGNLLLFPTGNP